ncbi:23S rRNA (guanosine(2251)-2'-O)-methyltransferase RlmB [bacterium]|nr:23S rRNA (guanosine(2251)-2'-O)-methyltransferase RlmB [bacterium]
MIKIVRINPLLEILRASPFRVQKIFIQKGTSKIRVREMRERAEELNIPLRFADKAKLDRMHPYHQGVVGHVADKGYVSLESILSASSTPFLVLLDEVMDPQNLGAIIRTAEGAGVDGLILPERRSAGLTEAVWTVSAGAKEHMKMSRVKNLARCMDDLRDRGLWLVGSEGKASEFWYEFDYTLPVGLVMGSEEKGLRPGVQKKCDKLLSIPMLGQVASLNVGAAASIFIYEVVRQRKSGKK